MPNYSEQDLKYAAELREAIHREALAIVRKTRPQVTEVRDRHPVEDYFQKSWEYPGRYYTVVAVPYGYKSRKALVDAIVRDTLAGTAPGEEAPDTNRPREAEGTRQTAQPEQPPDPAEDPFYRLLAEYPDLAVDYRIVPGGRSQGCQAHRRALKTACETLCGGWSSRPDEAVGHPIPPEALFSSAYPAGKLTYRKAFLYPPHENSYTGRDFARVNAALFPQGTRGLEVYEWTTDWSDYFDEGREWWGTLCLTVLDRALNRFVVILASATD